jgi:Putative peptidoglycan binding domain
LKSKILKGTFSVVACLAVFIPTMPVLHAAPRAKRATSSTRSAAPAKPSSRAVRAHGVAAHSRGRARHSSVHARKTSWKPSQQAPQADRIQEIQAALSREGYYTSAPSGKWDADTQDAVRHFQEANSSIPTGKLDAATLQKLGLGSDVAGLSPPRMAPPAPVSSQPPSY